MKPKNSSKLEQITKNASNFKQKIEKNYPRTCKAINFGGNFIGYSLIGMGAGAITGEIIDHLPYFQDAIPRAAEILAATRGNSASELYDAMHGNIDKMGALIGLVMGASKGVKNSIEQKKAPIKYK